MLRLKFIKTLDLALSRFIVNKNAYEINITPVLSPNTNVAYPTGFECLYLYNSMRPDILLP